MNILYAILFLIAVYVIDELILPGLVIFLTIPVTLLINKVEKRLGLEFKDEYEYLYRFRIDMVIQGILAGFIMVLLVNFFLLEYHHKLDPLANILIFSFLALIKLGSWKSHNPITYEISWNLSPILGYIVALLYFNMV